jgi:glycosyltransferase involved in cell wall biosynthesis
MQKHLIIDVRKAFHSGIGAYIRAIVPRVIDELRQTYAVKLVVADSNSDIHKSYLGDRDVEFVVVRSHLFSLREQFELRRVIPKDAVFWATSLSHPLFWSGQMVTMVHDVAQLALPMNIAGGRLVRVAAWIFLHSIRHSSVLLLYNSHFSQDEFHRYVGISSTAKEAVTYLAVEPQWFEKREITTAANQLQPYFICVGNIRPNKNLQILFKAFAKVIDLIPHNLIIIGQHDGFRTNDIAVLEQISSLGNRAQFLGRVDDASLRMWVSGAIALVFPSVYEGFGLPAIEAMASGCPVIAARAGALPEVCSSFAAYFAPYNANELAELLVRYANMSEDERADLRNNSIKRAAQFSWDSSAELTAKMILEVFQEQFVID